MSCLFFQTANAQKRPAKPPAAPKIKLPASVRTKPKSVMQVSKVTPSSRSRLLGAALELDQLVESQLAK